MKPIYYKQSSDNIKLFIRGILLVSEVRKYNVHCLCLYLWFVFVKVRSLLIGMNIINANMVWRQYEKFATTRPQTDYREALLLLGCCYANSFLMQLYSGCVTVPTVYM